MSNTANSTNYDRILADLKRLKLSTIRTHLDDHLRLAQSKSLTYLEFLQGLTSEELRGREESNHRRRLKSARFPAAKSLDEFDFAFQPALPRDKVLQLKECRWVANAENIIWAGQSGTGKSHLAIALGLEAIRCGYRVLFTTVADLMDQLNAAAAAGQVQALLAKLLKNDVLVLDELGYLKVGREQGNFLFRLVSKAYEKSSLVITTNKDFSGWAEIFEDAVQVSAMLDRLLHHCLIFSIKGDSYRVRKRRPKAEPEAGKGGEK